MKANKIKIWRLKERYNNKELRNKAINVLTEDLIRNEINGKRQNSLKIYVEYL